MLGGMINWLYAVVTIFDQGFNICSPKFGRSMVPIAPPGYAPGSSDRRNIELFRDRSVIAEILSCLFDKRLTLRENILVIVS